MTIVDLAKARAYAATGLTCTDTAADWIISLADEVESLTVALDAARVTRDAAVADTKKLQDKNEQLRTGLRELYERVGAMLSEARHIVDHHPDPAASAAAMRIMREDKS